MRSTVLWNAHSTRNVDRDFCYFHQPSTHLSQSIVRISRAQFNFYFIIRSLLSLISLAPSFIRSFHWILSLSFSLWASKRKCGFVVVFVALFVCGSVARFVSVRIGSVRFGCGIRCAISIRTALSLIHIISCVLYRCVGRPVGWLLGWLRSRWRATHSVAHEIGTERCCMVTRWAIGIHCSVFIFFFSFSVTLAHCVTFDFSALGKSETKNRTATRKMVVIRYCICKMELSIVSIDRLCYVWTRKFRFDSIEIRFGSIAFFLQRHILTEWRSKFLDSEKRHTKSSSATHFDNFRLH